LQLSSSGVGNELAARWPLVACHSVFSGPRKHLGKIFKSEIFSNLSQLVIVLRLTWTETSFYFHSNRFVHLYYAHQQFMFTQRCLERWRHPLP